MPVGDTRYALTEDGRLINWASEVIAEDVVSVHFDGMTYHLYYVCKDGRCGEYCSEEGREISNRYEIKLRRRTRYGSQP